MSFSDIIGQERSVSILRSALRGGNVSHAYLFSGPEGIGKRLVALNFAKALNCLSLNDDACGKCIPCKKFDNENFPDFLRVEPVEGSIKIELIRELRKKISFRPYEGKFKVVFIYKVEDMTSGAANSFLKTLEEPTEATVFILVSHNFNLLLPTIISRCQIIQFHLIPLEIIKNKLINDFQIAPENARLISSYSQGSLGKALEMDVSDVQEKRHEILAFLNKISFKEIDLVFKKSKEWSNDSRRVETILQTTLNLIRDMAILKITGKEKFITNLDVKDKLMSLSNSLNLKQLLELFNTVEETIRYFKRNINIQLLLDLLFIKICNVLERRAYGR